MGSTKRFLVLIFVLGIALWGGEVEGAGKREGAVVYLNARYHLRVELPESWRGYSVLRRHWEGEGVDAKKMRGLMLVIRHPAWKVDRPRQDIPILVFTRRQWDASRGDPAVYPGGVLMKIKQNSRYVLTVHSRFDSEETRGWEEARRIVDRNLGLLE